MHKRMLGLDVGDVRIGVAVSDALGITAQAVSTIHRRGLDSDLQAVLAYLDEYQAETIVLGLPLNMDGSSGPQAEKTKGFGEALSARTAAKLVMWDERLTSSEARKALIEGGMRRENRKRVIDQVAAMLILQSYLDAQAFAAPVSPAE